MRGALTKISIAMATFNGELFIREQLQSFLVQTRHPDELIVTDDGSSDATLRLLADFSKQAPFSVEVHRNKTRLGYSRNFERAISLCRGEIIFLSDQDDVWFSDKLKTVVRAFEEDRGVQVVVNDQLLTDAALRNVGVTKLDNLRRAGKSSDGLIEGCCSAFRREWGALLFPVPSSAEEMIRSSSLSHDRWLNEISILLSARRVIDRPLQYFRRTGENVTSWVLSEPKRVRFGDLRRERKPVAPINAWRNRLEVLQLYDRWLFDKRAQLDKFGAPVEDARDLLVREQKSLEDRIQLACSRLPKRVPQVLSLLRRGGYGYFNGWKSALNDLIRPAHRA